MTLIAKHNIAKMYSATTGTGTLTLTTAVALCNTFALAGVVDGEKVTYVITDPVAGREHIPPPG
jgi:phosphate/sulfate permease